MIRQLVGIAALYGAVYLVGGWRWTLGFLLVNLAWWGLKL